MTPRSLTYVLALLLLATITIAPLATGAKKTPPGKEAPTNLSPPTVSGTAQAGASLTADPGTWSGAGVKTAIQWQRCDSAGGACVDVPRATSTELALASSDVGYRFRVVVTASNRNGEATAVSDPSSVVAAAPAPAPTVVPPSPATPPSITGTAKQGELLAADPGTWNGTQPMSYGYQWQRCDSDGGSCTAVAGATAETYTLVSADVGATMRVAVTASNSAGSATATSSATGVVAPSTTTSSSSSRLTWAPPVLSNPLTVQVQDTGQACPSGTSVWQNPNQPWICYLASDVDYVLKLGHRREPAGTIGGLVVTGGRSVVIVGGQVTLAAPIDPNVERQGLTFHSQTGTVHVEGVLVDGVPGQCLVLNSSQAVFQIENFRCEGVAMYKENFSAGHSDILMTWKSPPEIRIDKFTSDYDGTGLAFYGQQQSNGSWTYPQKVVLKRTNIRNMQTSQCSNFTKPLGVAYVSSSRQTRIEVDRMYTETGWGRSSTTADCPLPGSFQWKIGDAWFTYDGQNGYSKSQKLYGDGISSGSYFEFTNPNYDNVWGVGGSLARVDYGVPDGVDYVPRGLAGTGYTSPGYGG